MENFETMQQAGVRFIQTLTPSDFIAVNLSGTHLPFVPASAENSDLLTQIIMNKRFVSDTADQQSLLDAFQIAFVEFEREIEEPSCHHLIVLLCDSSLDDSFESSFLDLQMTPATVDIFAYTFGGLDVDPTVPQSLACSHGGAWFGLTASTTSIDDIVPRYLSFYSAALRGGVVRWTEGGVSEDVLTGCMPIYENPGADGALLLLGVACIGLNATSLRQLDNGSEVS